MSKKVPIVFKKSLLAAAVASLSACAMLPQVPNADSEGIGGGIIRAGQATANAGLRTWNRTTEFLGFRETDEGLNENNQSGNALLAQQNTSQGAAGAETSVVLQPTTSGQPAIIQQAEAPQAKLPLSNQNSDTQLLTDASSDTSALARSDAADVANTNSDDSSIFTLDQPLTMDVDPSSEIAQSADADSTTAIVRTEDLIHKVSESETLWDISKLTTGNANNWHSLADINDLTQSATVFPGQELVIPADMVKPGYGTSAINPALADNAISQNSQEIASTDSALISQSINSADAAEATTEITPQIAAALPEDAATLPDAAAALPDAAAALPEDAATLPDAATALPEDATALPEDAAALPEDETALLEDATALVEDNPSAAPINISENATPINLLEGETLWEFSRRTTGNATNWQAIAKQNNFTEKQAVTVRPGQTIYVPQSLLKQNDDTTNASAEQEKEPVAEAALPAVANDTNTAAMNAEPAAAQIALTTEEITAIAAQTDESQTVQIIEAAYKDTDAITPSTNADSDAIQLVAESEAIHSEVMVSGTYYPKAVYNNADFSSSLLMRVSPGTTLQVSRAMGSWFEVETEKGVGYVHQRDIQ